jgi:hypothetical protein
MARICIRVYRTLICLKDYEFKAIITLNKEISPECFGA